MKLFNFLKRGEESASPGRNSSSKREKPVEKKKVEQSSFSEAKDNKLVKLWKPRPIDVEKFFPRDEIIVSKTDTRGNITYGNQLFVQMAGYTEYEMLGQPHNIIRHPDMPQLIFKALWDTISQGKEINAFVINLSKDGRYYWVFANVTPSFDEDLNIVGYHSVRRKPNPKAIEIIVPFYKSLKKAEAIGGMHESMKELVKLLESQNMSYEKLVLHLQYGL